MATKCNSIIENRCDYLSTGNTSNNLTQNTNVQQMVFVIYEGESFPVQQRKSKDEYSSFSCKELKSLCKEEKQIKEPCLQLLHVKEKVVALKDRLGFNISEIAAILQVGRPTVYEWLETKTPKLRKNNKKRLDEIYKICQKWDKTNLGRLGTCLRKTVCEGKSLFDLLASDKINHNLVNKTIISLKYFLEKSNKEKESRKAFIHKYGLEEQIKKRISDTKKTHRSIG